MKKFLIFTLIASLTLSSFTGCGSKSLTVDEADSTSETVTEENTAHLLKEETNKQASDTQSHTESDHQRSVTFTDDIGREVLLPATVNRIVPSSSLAQIILYAIAPEMMVGLSNEWYETGRGIIEDSHFELPVFGNFYSTADLNVEELALTAPHVIIDIGEPKKSVKEDMDALQSQTNIPSVFISSSLETMPQTFRTLGQLLGKEEKAEELASYCEKVYERSLHIMEQVKDQKVNTLYLLGEEGLNVIAATSYHAELLDLITNNLAVVDNPISKGSGNEVTMEQLMLWNPDFIIFGPGSIYNGVSEMETWNQMKAIQAKNYVEVPDMPHNWMSMPPAVQRYLGLLWLPYVLYPEYCDYDIKEEILEYHRLFYGCELTDEQYDTITQNAFLINP